MAEPAYTRLDVDERRRQLLELGVELFTAYAFDELSMAEIARRAGISKALLYHYFPSKSEYFQATLQAGIEDLRARTEPDPDLAPLEQLTAGLDAYLGWIEDRAASYEKLLQSAASVPEVRTLIDEVRGRTSQRILEGLFPDGPPPRTRTAVQAWLWFMDGACLDWIRHRDLERSEVRDLLLGTLFGALTAAGQSPATTT